MTTEAKNWFEAQAFRLGRLKQEGKDVGQVRITTEQVLFDEADKRIDKYFERRRNGKANRRC